VQVWNKERSGSKVDTISANSEARAASWECGQFKRNVIVCFRNNFRWKNPFQQAAKSSYEMMVNITIKNAKKHLQDKAAFQDISCREINGRKLYACKILCALIDHAVKEEGKATIAKWICDIINAAPDTETAAKELAALANSWVEHFFLPRGLFLYLFLRPFSMLIKCYQQFLY
jgi:hypothetical protein